MRRRTIRAALGGRPLRIPQAASSIQALALTRREHPRPVFPGAGLLGSNVYALEGAYACATKPISPQWLPRDLVGLLRG